MLPAYAADALPVLGNHFNFLPCLATPVDGGCMLGKKPLFGHSKTIRGFVIGTGGAVIVGFIQFLLQNFDYIQSISLINYDLQTSLILGFLLGFGTLLGDLIKSFLKRRIGITSGSPWIIADQIDYVVGALLLASPIIIPETNYIIAIFLLSAILALTANIISYITGMKDVWW
ncbi:CDP-archaeol synthase [Patescibacteria group bacterium]|nr:CDP-archaeol synthase [Patescibacteria group bacterium]